MSASMSASGSLPAAARKAAARTKSLSSTTSLRRRSRASGDCASPSSATASEAAQRLS